MRGVSQLFSLLVLCLAVGCSPVPEKYLREAIPNATLSAMAATPQVYQGRLVVMGAVIVKGDLRDGALWLHVKNRPLDQEYRPRLPSSADDPESGWFWVVVESPQTFPSAYHHWADMTVVGRVIRLEAGKEPVLKMVYARGWGLKSQRSGVWEHVVDANYTLSTPAGAIGELGQ